MKARNSIVTRIQAMHRKFGITPQEVPFGATEEMSFRVKAMREEVEEFETAFYRGDKAEQLDAMVDLVVFAIGTADRLGIADAFETAFDRVMDANMLKNVGEGKAERGSFHIDLVKPEGWVAPDHSDLIEKVESNA